MSNPTTPMIRGAQFMPTYHRPWFRYIETPEGGEGGAGTEGGDSGAGAEAKFTQADLDKAVRERLARERAKFADYDDLKSKAEGAKTLESRIADLEENGRKSEQRALRAEIAAEFGISTQKGADGAPSQAELFLTGADEATLRAQAKSLADMATAKKNQNVAPKEGGTKQSGTEDDSMRGFVHDLFGSDD